MTSTLFIGSVLTLDESAPRAGAVLVVDGHIAAVGSEPELRQRMPSDAVIVELGDRVLMPGLIEPHSHPTSSAVLVSDHVIDIRPVIVMDADAVMNLIREAIATRPDGVMANGWDPLLQRGLENPTLAGLDELAGGVPLVILHNSGHTAFFNTAAAERAGISGETPDPAGASYDRDDAGQLTGIARETAAIFAIAGPALNTAYAEFDRLIAAELLRASAAGVTTVCDMS